MKIESILKRPGGTKAEIGGTEYHFEPLADGAHVANVENESHIDRFLSIAEAYKVYHGKEEPKGAPVSVSAPEAVAAKVEQSEKKPEVLKSSTDHPPQFEIGGLTYTLGDVTRRAFELSGLTEDDWNELGEDEIAAKIDITLDDMAEQSDAAQTTTEPADEREALVEQYKAKFGKAPHHKASIETIKAKMAE